MDQKQLADALGVKVPFISQYEHDRRNPKTETLKRIADAIGVSVYELMDPDENTSDGYEQIHMFNMAVEELKVQINFLKSNGMHEEAAVKEKELKTMIGEADWQAGPSGIKKEPAPESGLDAELLRKLMSLTPDELVKVDAFVQGLIAAR